MKPIPLVFTIWGALCISICIYAVMSSAITYAPSHGDRKSFGGIIALAAGSAAILSLFMRKMLLGGFTAVTLSLDDQSQRGRFIAGNIILFALSEGVGVLGFFNGTLANGRGEAWLPYIGLALLLMLLHIPLPSRFKPAA